MKRTALTPCSAPPRATLPQRIPDRLPPLVADAPATAAMTDFTCVCPVVVSEDRRIEEALEDMIRFGVRALLVVRDGEVRGLITSYDIQGERPIQFLPSADCLQDKCRHSDIRVADIMTPWHELRVLSFEDVWRARAGDVAEIFRTTAATHLLVVAPAPDGSGSVVRGLFSRTRLERHLGECMDLVMP